MSGIQVICFFSSYLIAFIFELTRLFKQTKISRFVMLGFALAGWAAHTIYLFQRSQQSGLPPLLSSTADWLLVLAWLVVLFYLFLTFINRDLALGIFLLPLAIVLVSAAYFTDGNSQQFVAQRGWAMIHSALLVLGIAGTSFGFVLSLMYLVQHRRLKQKAPVVKGMTLPSLERLKRMNWWSVVISIPLLTLGLATGVGLGWHSRHGAQPFDFLEPMVIVSGVVWLVMVLFLCWLSLSSRVADKRVAWVTLWAFGFLLVTFVGLQVLSGGHQKSRETRSQAPKSPVRIVQRMNRR